MSDEDDFERAWLKKLSENIEAISGVETVEKIMIGSESFSKDTPRDEIIDWTINAMNKMDELIAKEDEKEIMTSCACHYPQSDLNKVRTVYESTGSIVSAHKELQAQFIALLRDNLKLQNDTIQEIVKKGWGSAGILKENKIIATKIPKSGYLIDYLKEKDKKKRQQMYCHCPRIREIMKTSKKISTTYCYCGAGFYKNMWEVILQKAVEIEIIKSIMKGDDMCQFEIKLSDH